MHERGHMDRIEGRGNEHDFAEDIYKIIEVGSKSRADLKTIKLRLWRRLTEEGFDVPELEAEITAFIERDRREKGRLQPGPYNAPPAPIRKQFERTRREVMVPGTKKSAPAQVRYQLQGPIERYGVTDLTQEEQRALHEFTINCMRAIKAYSAKTVDYDAVGGGGGPRGGVTDRDRLAYNLFLDRLGRFPRTWHEMLLAMCQGTVKATEIGAWMIPAIRDDKTRRGVARGWIRTVAQCLHEWELAERSPQRVLDHTVRRQIEQEYRERERRRG